VQGSLCLDGKLGRRRGQINALGGLVYLQDSSTEQRFLVNTGAPLNLSPPPPPPFRILPPPFGILIGGGRFPNHTTNARAFENQCRSALCPPQLHKKPNTGNRWRPM
jgi:hypothetical protein